MNTAVKTTATHLNVRVTCETDAPSLRRFHRALYADHPKLLVTPTQLRHYTTRELLATIDEHLEQCMASADTILRVAEVDSTPCGYAIGYIDLDERREIERVGIVESWYVADEFRGRGFGRVLMAELLSVFRRRGCEAAESGTYASNIASRRAHAALGFWDFEVRMRCDLGPSWTKRLSSEYRAR